MKVIFGRIAIGLGLLFITAALCLVGYNMWEDKHAFDGNMAVVAELDQIIPNLERTYEQVQPDSTSVSVPLVNAESPVPAESHANEENTVKTDKPAPAHTNIPKDYELNPDMPMPTINMNGEDYIGILEIPAHNLRLSILGELTVKKLKIAPCRYTGSAYTDDMVIAAHNYARFFGCLGSMRIGEEVRFIDLNGNCFTYRVSEVEVLSPDRGGLLINNNPQNIEGVTAWNLTLFTCTKGSPWTRTAVRCMRVE